MTLQAQLDQLRLDYRKALDAGDTVMCSEIKRKGLFLKGLIEKQKNWSKPVEKNISPAEDNFEFAKKLFTPDLS